MTHGPYTDPVERFWSKVDRSGGPYACWPWLAGAPRGYGMFYVDAAEHTAKAHRVAYRFVLGPIPNGLTIDHLCRNKLCVNPAHLEPVTNRENVLRGVGPTATHARQTHCRYGHPFSPENTYVTPNERRCRLCCRELHRKRRARVRALRAALTAEAGPR